MEAYLYLSLNLFVATGSEELLPHFDECSEESFMCGNSLCVSLDKVCNGIEDCGDSSDEADCSKYNSYIV